MDADSDRITREMEELERRWFEAHRAALDAEADLRFDVGADRTVVGDAETRLARAQRDKQTIMRLLEALEDDLANA